LRIVSGRVVEEVVAYPIVEGELPLLLEVEESGSRELLGDGGKPKDGVRGDRNPFVQVRVPEPLGQYELAASNDGDRESGGVDLAQSGCGCRVHPVSEGDIGLDSRRGHLARPGPDTAREGQNEDQHEPPSTPSQGVLHRPILCTAMGLEQG
jgi:hypothetical protein